MFYISLFVQIILKNYYVSASTSFEMIFTSLLIGPTMNLPNLKAQYRILQSLQVVIGKNYPILQPVQVLFGLIAITTKTSDQD